GTIIGANREDIRIAWRFSQGGCAAAIGLGDLLRDRPQVVAAVQRAEDDVARAVVNARIVMAQNKRGIPVEAVALALRSLTGLLGLTWLRRPDRWTGRSWLRGLSWLRRCTASAAASASTARPNAGRFSRAPVAACEAAVLALPVN